MYMIIVEFESVYAKESSFLKDFLDTAEAGSSLIFYLAPLQVSTAVSGQVDEHDGLKSATSVLGLSNGFQELLLQNATRFLS